MFRVLQGLNLAFAPVYRKGAEKKTPARHRAGQGRRAARLQRPIRSPCRAEETAATYA